LRYQPVLETVIRASFGTGFRTVELFNEYSNVMASSRDIIITEKLEPEKMLNYGVDLLQYFNFKSVTGSVNLDFYRTEFKNKVIPDYDTDPTKIYFANSEGDAYSNIVQAEINMNILRYFDIKTAYKFIEIKYMQNGVMVEQPFNAKHRVLSTFSYAPQDKSWIASFGVQWFGKARMPSTASNPAEYQRPTESEQYTLINAQLSKNFKLIEIYAGVDNLLDYIQEDAIISNDDPFGPYFDTSFIWGPTKGREFYAGIRLKIN
jgi:outer membrane receptor protein involved in Fe transport